MTTYLTDDASILLVDDEFLVLWALQDELESLGFQSIHTASNVDTSLSMLETRQFGFAFLDVNLGDQKSFAIAEVLEEKDIPFAFVTGYGRAGLEGRFEGVPVIQKPAGAPAIMAVVRPRKF